MPKVETKLQTLARQGGADQSALRNDATSLANAPAYSHSK